MMDKYVCNVSKNYLQVIVIDWDPNSTKLHPENTLNIDRWLGNDDDMALFDLVAFLNSECEPLLNRNAWKHEPGLDVFICTAISSAEVADVREVITYYKQFDNPLAQFRENQRKLLEQMQEREHEEQSSGKPAVRRWTPSFLAK